MGAPRPAESGTLDLIIFAAAKIIKYVPDSASREAPP